MSTRYTSTFALGLMGTFAVGIWVGAVATRHTVADAGVTAEAILAAPSTLSETPARELTVDSAVPTVAAVTRTKKAAVPRRRTASPAAPATTALALAPRLSARLRPLFTSGVDMGRASFGFRNAEQFAAVAHASRNTGVPFMLLKDRVLTERHSLSVAISGLKPGLDAPVEANLAVAQARKDLAELAG